MSLEENINSYFSNDGRILKNELSDLCKKDLTKLFNSIIEYYTPKSIISRWFNRGGSTKKEYFEIKTKEGNNYLIINTKLNDLINSNYENEKVKEGISKLAAGYLNETVYLLKSWLNDLKPSEVGVIQLEEKIEISKDNGKYEASMKIINAEQFLGFDSIRITDKKIEVVLAPKGRINVDNIKRTRKKLIDYLKTV